MLLGFACCIIVAAVMLATPGRAAAATGVVMGPQPPSFIPDWDGVNDSTAVSYTLRRRSSLLVTVRRTGNSAVIRTLVDESDAAPGERTDYWDGRTSAGAIVEAGTYEIVAKVTPLIGGLGTTQASSTVTVQRPNVALARMSVSSGVVSRVAGHDSTSVGMSLSGRGFLTAVVVAPNGRVVRNLFAGRRPGGVVKFIWDGKTDNGAQASDGKYQVMATGSGGAFPTSTLKAPIRVDTKAPTFTLNQKSYAARVTGGKILYDMRLKLSESARVAVTVPGLGTRSHILTSAKGRRSVAIDSSSMGARGHIAARTYTMTVTATDAGGNRSRVTVPLTVVAPRIDRTPVPAPVPAPVTDPAQPVPPTAPAPQPSPGAVMVWPTRGTLTSGFGPRWGRMHTGIDLAATTGTPIYAATSGTVTFSGTMSGYGNTITIDHGGGISTLYAHQSRLAVVSAQFVVRGELIGYVGNTGNSTGAHLHFEVRTKGTPVNPIPYFS